MTLAEKQFELDGVVFGLDAPVGLKADGWTPGAPALRTSDVDRAAGDGVRMGRDFKGAATWSFSLFTDGQTEDEAWASLARLAEAWDADTARSEPDAVLPLRYRMAGQERVVYGRPRRWTPTVNNLVMGGRIDVEADFDLVYHLIFDGVQESRTIGIAAPLDLAAGLMVPFTPPFTTSAGASVRESSVTIGGSVPTPITVTFNGPVTNAAVRVGGWMAALEDTVYADDPATIDGRPWVRAATTRSGGGVRVSPRVTRISKMWLPPGTHEVIFTGEDPTSSASVEISWHNAYRSPR